MKGQQRCQRDYRGDNVDCKCVEREELVLVITAPELSRKGVHETDAGDEKNYW